MSIAVHLRFAVVAAATLLLGPTGLKGGDDFSREVLVMREKPGDRRWEIALETGALFGVRNPNNYVIAPQLLSLAWQPFPQWQIGPVRIRGQILATFAGEAILHGPESYFLGGALRARLIFPLGTSPWSLYADGGGGIGAIDSDDTPFGQGEDFAFCLLASGGVRFAFSKKLVCLDWFFLATPVERGHFRASAPEYRIGFHRTRCGCSLTRSRPGSESPQTTRIDADEGQGKRQAKTNCSRTILTDF